MLISSVSGKECRGGFDGRVVFICYVVDTRLRFP